MKKRVLGQTGEKLSVISFGGAAISGDKGGYSFGETSEKLSEALIAKAYEYGINHFDTAPIYGFGESEKRLGKYLKPIRDKVYITSKSGITWDQNFRVDLDNSAKTTRLMLEQSLRNLDSEYIDFYYIHWPDPRVDIRTPMEVLAKAKEQGKIRHIGLSNTNEKEFYKASEIEEIDMLQGQYQFLAPDLDQLSPLIKKHQLGCMSWGTYHKGVLTGRVKKDTQYKQSDARKKSPWWKRSQVNKEIDLFSPIQKELLKRKIDLRAFALGFVLKNDFITTAMVGMRTLDYLEQTVKVLDELPEESLYDELTLS